MATPPPHMHTVYYRSQLDKKVLHKPFLRGFKGCTDRLWLQIQPGIDNNKIYQIFFCFYLLLFPGRLFTKWIILNSVCLGKTEYRIWCWNRSWYLETFATAEAVVLVLLGTRFIRNSTPHSSTILKSLMPAWQWLRSAAFHLDALWTPRDLWKVLFVRQVHHPLPHLSNNFFANV